MLTLLEAQICLLAALRSMHAPMPPETDDREITCVHLNLATVHIHMLFKRHDLQRKSSHAVLTCRK